MMATDEVRTSGAFAHTSFMQLKVNVSEKAFQHHMAC